MTNAATGGSKKPAVRAVPAEQARRGPVRALAGWGQHPVVDGVERVGEELEPLTEGAILSRGLGRAYGDASLPPEGASRHVAGTPLADRVLHFDAESGLLRAEAGLSLAAMNELFLPRGFFTPVSPGTAHVTLGGMVASDVHGKNHHVAGCFGEYVRSLRMRVADGRILEVDDETEPELFRATLGGMGLTGHILEVEVSMQRVPSPWIYRESERIDSLEELLARLCDSGRDWPMTVAWIDSTARGRALGRGILTRGRWATAEEAPPEPPRLPFQVSIPFPLPSGLANRHTLRLVSALWFHAHSRTPKAGIANTWFWIYPLDWIAHWHRAFGRRGFTQYQCVLPGDVGAYRHFLEIFQQGGGSSFVNVFKDCGAAGRGTLSFPQPGVSFALDIPIARDPERTRRLVEQLNDFVIAQGGRIYLAKDAFTSREQFRAMYPRFDEWNAVRRRWDPEGRLASAQSRRLMGD